MASAKWNRAWLPLLSALVVLVVDLVTKEWALRALSPVGQGPRIRVIPGFMDFLLAFNTGGAFSIFHDRPWIITTGAALITFALLVWAVYWSRTAPRDVPAIRMAFGLILGGAVGNLIDRIRYQFVVDFIHTYVRVGDKEYAWPTFNIADSGIVVGIGIFLFYSLFTDALDPKPAVEGEGDGATSAAEGTSDDEPGNGQAATRA